MFMLNLLLEEDVPQTETIKDSKNYSSSRTKIETRIKHDYFLNLTCSFFFLFALQQNKHCLWALIRPKFF